MLYLGQFTNDPSQQTILTGIAGLSIQMQLQFYPRSQRWVMNINDGTFVANGIAVVTSLNLLRQWKNNISYGISCVRTDGLDPYQIDDFQNQVANLYLLDSTDVASIEQDWFEPAA